MLKPNTKQGDNMLKELLKIGFKHIKLINKSHDRTLY